MPDLVLPIYYTQEYKTKDDKTFLVGMNWYRNAFHHQANLVKKHYAALIEEQVSDITPIFGEYTINLRLYYKNPSCDGSNIFALMEKFTLDSLQELGLVSQDNVKYHIGTTTHVKGQDKLNPRVEVFIKGVTTNE